MIFNFNLIRLTGYGRPNEKLKSYQIYAENEKEAWDKIKVYPDPDCTIEAVGKY